VPVSVAGIELDVLASLEQDCLIRRDGGRDLYHFGHDIIEDWTRWRVLDGHREHLPDFLRELNEPVSLARPLQLLACAQLERNSESGFWDCLLGQLEVDEPCIRRWRQAILLAPLASTRATQLLSVVESALLRAGGRRLRELMVALRTTEVLPDFAAYPAVQMLAEKPERILTLLLSSPIPRAQPWLPFMMWLTQNADRLDSESRMEASRLMEIWQRRMPDGYPQRKEVGMVALRWLRQAGQE
jgi:hypothetical protein